MAAMIYDAATGAWKEAATPRIWDASAQVYKDSTGLVWDEQAQAWTERWGVTPLYVVKNGKMQNGYELEAQARISNPDDIGLAPMVNYGDGYIDIAMPTPSSLYNSGRVILNKAIDYEKYSTLYINHAEWKVGGLFSYAVMYVAEDLLIGAKIGDGNTQYPTPVACMEYEVDVSRLCVSYIPWIYLRTRHTNSCVSQLRIFDMWLE